jgi:hypothetical protein
MSEQRLEHLIRFYSILNALGQSIGGAKKLADCSGRMRDTGTPHPRSCQPSNPAKHSRQSMSRLSGAVPVDERSGSIVNGERPQDFTIFLRSVHGYPNLRCVSAIGQIDLEADYELISREALGLPVRIAAVYDARFHHYKLTAASNVLLGNKALDERRALWLVKAATQAADRLKDALIHLEQDVLPFTENLDEEA